MSRRWPALVLVLLAGAFLALGVWQLQRRAWKLDLIAAVDARAHAPPRSLPAPVTWPRINARDDAYRRVHARGVFLHEREALVQAVTELGPGWWVMTPLRTGDGVVLVNRGFVPAERRDPRRRAAAATVGESEVTGLLRLSEPRGGFLRRNDPTHDRWYSRDIAAIAAARRLDTAAPFFIDADGAPNPGGYPVGGLTVIAFRNTHLAYALTWFGLAALSLLGAAIVGRAETPRAPVKAFRLRRNT